MRVRIAVLTAVYLVVVSLAVYESRTLIRSILGFGSTQPGDYDNSILQPYINDSDTTQHPTVEYRTLFLEEFDSQSSQVAWKMQNGGTSEVRDGYAYLKIPANNDDGQSFIVSLWDTDANKRRGKWLYASVEVRLRCSDDNKLHSDVGGGSRYWGLEEVYSYPNNSAYFTSSSREADDYPVGGEFPWSLFSGSGFHTLTAVNGSVGKESFQKIDITEWHNYTILWEPDNITYLVDGQVVATSDVSPSVPMFFCITIWNNIGVREDGTVVRMDIERDMIIQVDYLRFFTTVERFNESSQDLSTKFSRVAKGIEEVWKKGIDIRMLNQQLDAANRTWGDGYYSHYRTTMTLDDLDALIEEVLENHEEVSLMFDLSQKTIDNARGEIEDRNFIIMEGYMNKAQDYWDDLDCVRTLFYLQRILDMYPGTDDSNALG